MRDVYGEDVATMIAATKTAARLRRPTPRMGGARETRPGRQ